MDIDHNRPLALQARSHDIQYQAVLAFDLRSFSEQFGMPASEVTSQCIVIVGYASDSFLDGDRTVVRTITHSFPFCKCSRRQETAFPFARTAVRDAPENCYTIRDDC